MNKTNLLRLADYLDQPLAKGYSFDMKQYADSPDNGGHGHLDCGSCGCAVGHGPYAGIEKFRYESWDAYSERVFDIARFTYEWNYLFGIFWATVDNSPAGAAARIRSFVEADGQLDRALNFDVYMNGSFADA